LDSSGGNGTPERGGRVDHGCGLLIVDLAAERAFVDIVVDDAGGPAHRLADYSRIEVGSAGDPFRSAARSACGARKMSRARLKTERRTMDSEPVVAHRLPWRRSVD